MSYMTLMQTFVVLTLNELIYYLQSTISYVPSLYTPWDVMTSIALSMISINYVSRRFLNNLKCTVIHFKIIKNTKN